MGLHSWLTGWDFRPERSEDARQITKTINRLRYRSVYCGANPAQRYDILGLAYWRIYKGAWFCYCNREMHRHGGGALVYWLTRRPAKNMPAAGGERFTNTAKWSSCLHKETNLNIFIPKAGWPLITHAMRYLFNWRCLLHSCSRRICLLWPLNCREQGAEKELPAALVLYLLW